jgi:hypothetical protein
MPFKPGKSGNPSGRPRMPEELKRSFQEAAPKALRTLIAILDGENGAKPSDQVRAAEVLMNRGYGMPVQAVEAEITDLRPIVFSPEFAGLVKRDANPETS